MAKKETLDYGKLKRSLKEDGLSRVYLLYGPEEYLREDFLSLLKKTCLPDGADDFSYKRFNQETFSARAFEDAVDALPFLTERTFVEVRGVELNRIAESEADKLCRQIGDIPDYCTVVFVQDAGYEPDGRKKLIKTIKKYGQDVEFTEQPQSNIAKWVRKRFAAHHKDISPETADYLITYSGHLMQQLIPEIEKVAAYAPGPVVTVADIEAVASKSAETAVYELSDKLAARNYDGAALVMGELLGRKDTEPIMLLAMIANQMRNIYAAKLAQEEHRDKSYLTAVTGVRFDFLVRKLQDNAKKFSTARLERAVELCAETDFAMKSSSAEDEDLLKELLIKLAFDETAGQT